MLSMKLGQHFLKNKKQLGKIVAALNLKSGDVVVEIGPGHGELTKNLKSQISNLKIIAIEKDRGLANLLSREIADKNIEIIQGDALRVIPKIAARSSLQANRYKLTGNIPYYITGYLFRILGELANKPELIIFLIQKEVAERICASPPHSRVSVGAGPPKMNLLAASVQFWAEPKIIGYVSKRDFQPQPKVDSAIIKLITDYRLPTTTVDNGQYFDFIKILFRQPRKTILNNLVLGSKYKAASGDKKTMMEKLKKIGINPEDRPQNLGVGEIIRLTRVFYP